MRFNAILMLALAIVVCGLIATVVHQDGAYRQLSRSSRESCRQANQARAALNVWGDALDQFLAAAEQARRSSGSRSDIAAAAKYAELQGRVQPLGYRDCDGDGESDQP